MNEEKKIAIYNALVLSDTKVRRDNIHEQIVYLKRLFPEEEVIDIWEVIRDKSDSYTVMKILGYTPSAVRNFINNKQNERRPSSSS